MKRAISVSCYVLFVLTVLLPFGTLFSACFGYTFEFADVTVFAIVTTLLSVLLAFLSIKEKEAPDGRVIRVLFALFFPLSLINAVFYIIEDRSVLVIACMFVCVCCSLFLTVKHGKPSALKITALTLSVLMLFPIGFLGFTALIFGDMVKSTVVKSIQSPGGVYYAEVTDSDQGAFGGDTLVDVYKNKGINALIFRISQKPQRVWDGDWGEHKDMEIHWKDDSCLVINSVEYIIE